jgi:hypothetical protein
MGIDGASYSADSAPYTPPPTASGKAVAALAVGIAGFFCCNLLGPVAWYLGASERSAIRAGRSSPSGDGLALAGMIIGIVDTAVLVLGALLAILWIFLAGGLAILSAASGH